MDFRPTDQQQAVPATSTAAPTRRPRRMGRLVLFFRIAITSLHPMRGLGGIMTAGEKKPSPRPGAAGRAPCGAGKN